MTVPIILLEGKTFQSLNSPSHHHPNKLLHISKSIQHDAAGLYHAESEIISLAEAEKEIAGAGAVLPAPVSKTNHNDNADKKINKAQDMVFDNMEPESDIHHADAAAAAAAADAAEEEITENNNGEEPASPLARGVNKLPLSRTPALIGAGRGHIECDVPVDEERLAFWSSPQGDRDQVFDSPFRPKDSKEKEYYLTFQPDRGGWNNIRMSMEILFVMAAATGRTLVLPPKLPLYLLGHGKEGARSFGDFFPLHNLEMQKKVKVITMKEFIEKESPAWKGLIDEDRQRLARTSDLCLNQGEEEDLSCTFLNKHLKQRGFQPEIKPTEHCYIFDEDVLERSATTADTASAVGLGLSDEAHLDVDRFCGSSRKPVFYDQKLAAVEWIHWDAGCEGGDKEECWRLLSHFYTFMYFTDPKVDNYYKRFVRDFLHYNDAVYCAAWKVIDAVQKEADKLAVPWSAWHVRRGDLQYKKVKIPAEEWYENTKELWRPGELIYIATDERNKKFFDPVKDKHHPVRFLDDYWEIAGLDKLDKTYIGMVDTIVASHGRVFAGTWFSTFSGFINRLRGYLGKSMKDSWYSFLPRKEVMHDVIYPEGNYFPREWQTGWLTIDSDERIEFEQKVESTDIHDKAVLILPAPATKEEKKENYKPIKFEKIEYQVKDLQPDSGFRDKPVARSVAGRPLDQTPAVKNAQRAHIDCDVNVDSLAYWNDPQGTRDETFQSPFSEPEDTKYITFAPDRGGWNNIRMCMEIIFVIAAATGRTLVLPPKAPLYLLGKGDGPKHRGFGDFFPLETAEFQKRLKVISMEEFLKREGGADGRLPIPADKRTAVENAAEHCDRRAASSAHCEPLYDYLVESGEAPHVKASHSCIVFDVDAYHGKGLTFENKQTAKRRCGERIPTYWNEAMQEPVLVHFRASEKEYRLLAHFYGMVYFTDPAIENYYKRFVRDFLHYHDAIYCAAGKIVKAVQAEGEKRGFLPDAEGGGGFSTMHVRRGDLQYKKVKIPAEEWYDNTKEVWKPGEILYIATDERNKTFFDPIKEHHDIRFLDDYFEMAGLKDLDPNYMGMIDTIVASRGRAFAGTWFSTFSGYINRMRGYHGMSMMDSWYSWLPRKDALHKWEEMDHFAYAFEWPDCWIGIDSDTWPSHDEF